MVDDKVIKITTYDLKNKNKKIKTVVRYSLGS